MRPRLPSAQQKWHARIGNGFHTCKNLVESDKASTRRARTGTCRPACSYQRRRRSTAAGFDVAWGLLDSLTCCALFSKWRSCGSKGVRQKPPARRAPRARRARRAGAHGRGLWGACKGGRRARAWGGGGLERGGKVGSGGAGRDGPERSSAARAKPPARRRVDGESCCRRPERGWARHRAVSGVRGDARARAEASAGVGWGAPWRKGLERLGAGWFEAFEPRAARAVSAGGSACLGASRVREQERR